MSLEFYCRIQRHLKQIILKHVGVLLSVEFFCLWSSTVAIPFLLLLLLSTFLGFISEFFELVLVPFTI
jgi:hypothetical protein